MLERLTAALYRVPNASDEQRSRAQLFIAAAGLAMLGALVGAVAFLFTGNAAFTPAALPALVGGVASLVALRLTGSVELASSLLNGVMLVSVVSAALTSRDLSLLGWPGLIPVGSLLYSSIRRSVLWLAVCVVAIGGAGAFLMREPQHLASVPVGLLLIRLLVAVLVVFCLTCAFALGRQRTQRSLEEARDEANRANNLKSQFLASISHEIRTPLNGVLGTTDALLAMQLSSDVRQQLLIIQKSGSSLLRTINSVLELSRIEAGRVELFPVATDLPALLTEVVDLFQARASTQGLKLTLEYSPSRPVAAIVDDLRLRQVVQNLVGNALKFTTQGSVKVRMIQTPSGDGRVVVRISVQDTGPGIAPEAHARLFSAFSQARPKSDRIEGTGLGLVISKQFIDLMQGTLQVDTELGKGSTFTVELLLAVADEGLVAAIPTPPPVAPKRRLNVLVVDDNEINLTVAVGLLTRIGHDTRVARDGIEALASIRQHRPDLVFMDCHMPELDGLEATRRLRAAHDPTPVVALTASVYSEDRARCLEAGMNGFLPKPLRLNAMQQAIDEMMALMPAPAPVADPAGRRVLVVEDDPHIRRMAVRLLRAEGFEVSDAGDVEAALILFERAQPDYLLVDHVLGGPEDGLSLAERLRQKRGGLRVVVTSGRQPSSTQIATLEAAGGRFLPKPYDRAALIASLDAGGENTKTQRSPG